MNHWMNPFSSQSSGYHWDWWWRIRQLPHLHQRHLHGEHAEEHLLGVEAGHSQTYRWAAGRQQIIQHFHSKYYCKQISCLQNTHCEYEVGVDPIPAIEDSVEFSLYLNFLGEPQTMSGPMEVGESISVECKEPGNYQTGVEQPKFGFQVHYWLSTFFAPSSTFLGENKYI